MFIHSASRRWLCTKITKLPGSSGSMEHLNLDAALSARQTCMDNVRRVPSLAFQIADPQRTAAVLVPLCADRHGKLSLLYTLRSSKLKSHSGQVSFPGGMRDPEDASLVDTALRETREELGVARDRVEVWGEFVAPIPGRNFAVAVTPVVGLIRNFDELKLTPNEDEVEEVFAVPLERLCDRQYFGFQKFKNGFTTPVFMAAEHRIWGMTAIVTHLFLSCLLSERVYPMAYQYVGYDPPPPPEKAKL